jgi:hypothetical protein
MISTSLVMPYLSVGGNEVRNMSNLLFFQIKGWWIWVRKNFSTTNTLSKLWKITQIFLLLLTFSSCNKSTNKVQLNDNKPRSNIIKTHSIINNDSVIYASIITYLQERKFILNDERHDMKNENMEKQYLLDINNSRNFVDNVQYYNSVNFDTYKTKKPMCNIIQLIFTDSTIADKYINEFVKEHKNEREYNIGEVYFITKTDNTIYFFQSWLLNYDSIMWNLKQQIDSLIIKPNIRDMDKNKHIPLNKFQY